MAAVTETQKTDGFEHVLRRPRVIILARLFTVPYVQKLGNTVMGARKVTLEMPTQMSSVGSYFLTESEITPKDAPIELLIFCIPNPDV